MSESKHTPGPWWVSGVRFKMNGGEWHSVNRYDENRKQDENIACVGFDPRTGSGFADARLIAAAPDMLEALARIKWKSADRDNMEFTARITYSQMDAIEAAIAKAEGKFHD